jgi:hypothetical protein
MVPDRGPFQRTIFPAATARHGELDGTTTGEASRRPAYIRATPQGQVPPVTVPAGCWGGLRTSLSGKAERFGMALR